MKPKKIEIAILIAGWVALYAVMVALSAHAWR